MDSLLFLSASRLVSRRPLPAVPSPLYPILFRAAFLAGRPLVLRDLVSRWPFPRLHIRRLLGRLREPLRAGPCRLCLQAVLLAVLEQLRPGRHSSRCHLRVLDMTGLRNDDGDTSSDCSSRAPDGMSVWSGTVALAKACLEASKHREQLRRGGSGSHPGGTIEVRADLSVNATSRGILWDALQAGNSGPLRLQCREFQAEELCPAGIVGLLECLDPSRLRRVELRFNNLGLVGLSRVLPQLSRFPGLRSLRLPYSNVDARRPTPEEALAIRGLARELGKLRNLRELNLGSSRLSGNLESVLGELQAPLESLELPFCSLIPTDLAFLSQSFHAPSLKKLDLSGHDFSGHLLRPLWQLLERSSASLLHLELSECQLGDSQLGSLLAWLRRCSRLRSLGLFGNPVSTDALRDFLWETTALPELRLVVHPIPLECYWQDPGWAREEQLDEERWEGVRVELGRLLESSGRAGLIWTSDPYGHTGALDYFSL